MKNHKRLLALGAAAVMTATLFAGCGPKENGGSANEPNSGAEGTDYKIAVVPKMTNIGWFQRMEEGVNAYNADNGTNYVYRGSAEGADQAGVVEQLLAEKSEEVWRVCCGIGTRLK